MLHFKLQENFTDKNIKQEYRYALSARIEKDWVLELFNDKCKNKTQDDIISSYDAFLIFYYALIVKDADIKKLQDAIVKPIHPSDVYYILRFAECINGADINKLQDAIVTKSKEINELCFLYSFAKYIEGADIDKLQNVVINLNCKDQSESLFRFAKYIPGTDILKLQDALVALNETEFIFKFAQYVSGADIGKIKKDRPELADKLDEIIMEKALC